MWGKETCLPSPRLDPKHLQEKDEVEDGAQFEQLLLLRSVNCALSKVEVWAVCSSFQESCLDERASILRMN